MRFALLLLLASTPAFADHEPVRDDIVDLRHDRWRNRRVFLGWTADNMAVIHVASCGTLDGSGSPFCYSALEVFGATKQSHTQLLAPPCKPCGPDSGGFAPQDSVWAVSTELASQAIHAERAALDALGTLQASAVGTLPTVQIAADACRVDVLVGKHRITGVMKLSTTQCVTHGGTGSFRNARLRDVQLSPDRRKLAVTFTVVPRFFEWGDPMDVTIVVDANCVAEPSRELPDIYAAYTVATGHAGDHFHRPTGDPGTTRQQLSARGSQGSPGAPTAPSAASLPWTARANPGTLASSTGPRGCVLVGGGERARAT